MIPTLPSISLTKEQVQTIQNSGFKELKLNYRQASECAGKVVRATDESGHLVVGRRGNPLCFGLIDKPLGQRNVLVVVSHEFSDGASRWINGIPHGNFGTSDPSIGLNVNAEQKIKVINMSDPSSYPAVADPGMIAPQARPAAPVPARQHSPLLGILHELFLRDAEVLDAACEQIHRQYWADSLDSHKLNIIQRAASRLGMNWIDILTSSDLEYTDAIFRAARELGYPEHLIGSSHLGHPWFVNCANTGLVEHDRTSNTRYLATRIQLAKRSGTSPEEFASQIQFSLSIDPSYLMEDLGLIAATARQIPNFPTLPPVAS